VGAQPDLGTRPARRTKGPAVTAPLLPDNPADREATIRSEVLDVLSSHGGETIVAGPPMENLVNEMTVRILNWLDDGRAGGQP
jgi:hypothetical protein